MVEKLLEGSKRYYYWLLFLVGVIAVCGIVYIYQLINGLGVTGMSRDVSWGLYISQFTYLVGVAASAVMLVLPAYFHHYQKFKIMIIFGEFMAIAAVVMCCLFIVVDLGQPQRAVFDLNHFAGVRAGLFCYALETTGGTASFSRFEYCVKE